jgi:hypothetical protein
MEGVSFMMVIEFILLIICVYIFVSCSRISCFTKLFNFSEEEEEDESWKSLKCR